MYDAMVKKLPNNWEKYFIPKLILQNMLSTMMVNITDQCSNYNKKIEKKENNNKSLQQKLAMLEGFGGQTLC